MWRLLLDLCAQARRPLVFIDFETAGLGGKPPVDIGVLVFAPWETPETDATTMTARRACPPGLIYAVSRRVDPLCPIDPGATAVHGVRDEDVRGKVSPFNDTEIVGYFQGLATADRALFVGHNLAGADVPWAQRWGYLPPGDQPDLIDTMRVVRRLQKEMPHPLAVDVLDDGQRDVVASMPCVGHGLDAYASSLTGAHVALLGARPEGAHGALADCCATARALARLLDGWGPLWPAQRAGVPAEASLMALVAALGAPPPGEVSWDGWLRDEGHGTGKPALTWTKGKYRGRPAHRDDWVLKLPRQPTGIDGEGWCSQHTADILAGLRPVAVVR